MRFAVAKGKVELRPVGDISIQRRRNDNQRKISVLERGWGLDRRGEVVPKCCFFLGHSMTICFWKFCLVWKVLWFRRLLAMWLTDVHRGGLTAPEPEDRVRVLAKPRLLWKMGPETEKPPSPQVQVSYLGFTAGDSVLASIAWTFALRWLCCGFMADKMCAHRVCVCVCVCVCLYARSLAGVCVCSYLNCILFRLAQIWCMRAHYHGCSAHNGNFSVEPLIILLTFVWIFMTSVEFMRSQIVLHSFLITILTAAIQGILLSNVESI